MRKDKNIALEMRRNGKSYNEIHRALHVSKSTLSGWFKGLEFSDSMKRQLINQAKTKWANNITKYNKKRSIEVLHYALMQQKKEEKKINAISKRELMLIGTALFWAEGSKKERWQVRFSNSNVGMVALMMSFFRNICMVPEYKFRIGLHIHSNISEGRAKNFWSKITKIPIVQFTKTQTKISRSSKFKRPPNTLPYGTIQIRINDVVIMNRLKGWVNGLEKAYL